MSVLPASGPRVSCAMNLALSRGRYPASARMEWYETDSGDGGALARLSLSGWIDRGALAGLEATLEETARRGVRRLLLDCSRVRHVELSAVAPLTRMLSPFIPGGLHLRGLSPHLRDLFRLAGCQEIVPSGFAAVGLATLPSGGPGREWTP